MPIEPSHSLVSPLVFIGYGDIARRVAERHPDHPIISLARHLAPPPAGHRAAWAALNFDLDRDEPPATLPPKAIWLYFAPPPNDGVVDTRVARWLAAIPPAQHPQGVIYASTTGAALLMDAASTVFYSDYNSYGNRKKTWRVGKKD